MSLLCLNHREEARVAGLEGSKGESGGYEGREVMGCGEEPGFYPESTREPWESKEQKRDQVRFAFLENYLGNGLKGSKGGTWETGYAGK